jgi:IclR family acetate operon transcriptional repressor
MAFQTVKTARRTYSITAVDRACAVLRSLAGAQPRSLSEIAERAALDEATTLRYLSALGQNGFVSRDEATRRYSMGLEVFQLGQHAVGSSEVRKVALPHLERLLEEFEETVNLATARDDRLVIIDVLESTRSIRRGATVGEVDFWHVSALGKAILAGWPEREARALLQRIERQRYTEHTLVEVDDLVADLRRTRERGYAIDDEEYEHGLRCVAAAVRDRRGRYAYAVSISAVAGRMPDAAAERAGRAAQAAAEAISMGLGFIAEEGERHGQA